LLLETCIKNCSSRFNAVVAQPSFMRTLEDLAIDRKGTSTKWGEVKEKALEIIQYLGQTFGGQKRVSFPEFYNTYAKLTAQGCIFPITQSTHGIKARTQVDEPELVELSSTSQRQQMATEKEKASADEIKKLQKDLRRLKYKLDESDRLCYKDREKDNYLDLVDFFEQCKPRVRSLIDLGAHGLLPDSLLIETLELNDRLFEVLHRLADPESTPVPRKVELPDFSQFKIRAPRAASIDMNNEAAAGRPRHKSSSLASTDPDQDCPALSIRTPLSSINTKIHDDDEISEDESTNLIQRYDESIKETSSLLSNRKST